MDTNRIDIPKANNKDKIISFIIFEFAKDLMDLRMGDMLGLLFDKI